MDFKKITDYLNLTTPYKEENIVEPEVKPQEPKFYTKQEPLEELIQWKITPPSFKISKKILRSGFVFIFLFGIFLVLAQDWVFLLVLQSKDVLPGRIYVYFKESDKEEIDSILNKYISKNLNHPKDFYEYIIFKVKPYLNLSDEK